MNKNLPTPSISVPINANRDNPQKESKYKQAIMCLLSAFFLLLSVCQSASAESSQNSFSEVIYSLPEGDWYPVHYKGKTSIDKIEGCSEHEGLFIELLDEVFNKRLGVDLNCHPRPWKRAQANVKRGVADFLITVPTEDRLKYSVKSKQPIFQLFMHVYTYADHPLIENIKNIKTVQDIVRLGLIPVTNRGNGWHKENIDSYGASTHYVNLDEDIIKFLAAKRADIMIDAAITTNYKIKKLGLSSKLEFTEVRFGPLNFHILMSKKAKAVRLMPAIDAAIKSMIDRGVLEKTTQKYLFMK